MKETYSIVSGSVCASLHNHLDHIP